MLPGTVNTVRGAVDKVGQVSDLGNPPTFTEDTLQDILDEQQEEIPITPQRQVRFETSTTCCKTRGATKGEHTTLQGASGVPFRKKPSKIPGGQRSFRRRLQ